MLLPTRAAGRSLRPLAGSRASLRPSVPPTFRAVPRCRRRLASSTSTPTTSDPPRPPADHRALGVQQELFTTSVYSPGSPIFLPNGARIFNRLVGFLRRQYVHYGFQEVITPTIYKKALWARSGHLENYADDMFTVTSRSLEERRGGEHEHEHEHEHEQGQEQEREREHEDEYGLKPMNCPGHCLIFAAQAHSYRELPIRYADFSPLHRNEVSGALSGLTRVRRFHQDDGHIFCRPSQIEDEIRRTLDFVRRTYEVLRLGPYRLVLSTRPAEHYIGTLGEWGQAEAALRSALDRSGLGWTLNEGDGAFYGPKIDIILRDSDGKEHQTATVQLDFQLPKRFDLEYQAPAPDLERRGETTTDPDKLGVWEGVRPVLIHRAVLGSVERLMALLIEHYNGKWPFWLNPRQVMVVTVNDTAPVLDMARHTRAVLLGTAGPRDVAADGEASSDFPHPTQLAVDLDDSPRSVPLKVREAKLKGYGAIVVVGPRDVQSGTVSVDTSGIPAAKDAEPQQRGAQMSPAELVKFLQSKVDTYQ